MTARACLLLAALLSLGAAAPDLAAGSSRQLAWGASSVSYPLTVPAGAKPGSTDVVSAITSGGSDVRARLTASLEGSAIVLTAAALAPGTYDVHVRLAGEGFETKLLTLQLVVPAAKLVASPAKLVLDQIGGGIVNGSLNLRETSRLSGATLRAVQPSGPAVSDQRETAAFLKAKGSLPSIDAGCAADVAVTANGEFPLGTSTGTLLIDAAELAQPLEVAYEVRARRCLGVIFIVALAGLFVGQLLRFTLANIQTLGNARLQARELLKRLVDEDTRRHDAVFRAALADIAAKLADTAKKNSADGVTKATTEASTALDKALSDLKTAADAARAKAATLATLLGSGRAAPAQVAALVSAGRTSLNLAASMLADDDAHGADEMLTRAAETFRAGLPRAVRAWRLSVADALAAWKDAGMGDPATARQMVDAVTPTGDPAAVLKALSDAQAQLWNTMEGGLRLLKGLVARASDAAGSGNGDVAKAKAALDEAEKMLAADEGTPELIVRLATTARDVRKLLVQYVDPKLDPTASLDQLSVRLKAPSGAPPMSPPRAPDITAPDPTVGVQRPMNLPRVDAIPDPAPRITWARTLSVVISGVLIALIATATYAKTFVGTGTELVAIFFWAFALNVGADAVITAAAKLPK